MLCKSPASSIIWILQFITEKKTDKKKKKKEAVIESNLGNQKFTTSKFQQGNNTVLSASRFM